MSTKQRIFNMWNFERLIQNNLTLSGVEKSVSMAFDGKDVWVGNDNAKIDIFTYWDSRTDDYEILNSDYFPNIEVPESTELKMIDTIDVSAHISTVNQLVKVYNKIYTYNACQMISINISTKEIEVIDIPSELNVTNILGANNKVWVISSDATYDKDSLSFYDTINSTWSTPVDIPGRFQKRIRDMVWAHDVYIIVSAFNDNGVHKFDSTTGSFIQSTTINRKPTHLSTNNSRQVLVPSFNGMISTYNQLTSAFSHTDGILDEAVGLVDDGSYLWSISPYLSRKKKNVETDALRLQSTTATHPLGGTFSGAEDYALQSFGSDEFKQILITPEFNYEYWNGVDFDTRTVKQYVFLLTDNQLFAFRNASLYRDNFISVRSTGMIGVGESGYYGETR